MTLSLTDYEIQALKHGVSLADGHAYHEPPSYMSLHLEHLQDIWREAANMRPFEMSDRFIASWSKITGEKVLSEKRLTISPTASNSIDILAAALKQDGTKVYLLEPTFDNIYQIFKRRGCSISPVYESFFQDNYSHIIKSLEPGSALFIVDPNNPTGRSLSNMDLLAIAALCAENDICLIIDRTFRFFDAKDVSNIIDDFDSLSLKYCLIEDTGKTWPTSELKLSILYASPHLSETIKIIYNEIYLCPSPFTMNLFFHFFESAVKIDFLEDLKLFTRDRKTRLAHQLAKLQLYEAPECGNASLPLLWVTTEHARLSSNSCVDHLSRNGINVLPGDQFYWSRADASDCSRVRISLFKRKCDFEKALSILNDMSHINGISPNKKISGLPRSHTTDVEH